MDHNPYTPPQASTETPIPPDVVARPFAVWLLIVLLLVFGLNYVVTTVRFVGVASGHLGEFRGVVLFAASLVWRLALIAIFFAAAYSAYRRRPWSRWFGVALIVALAALVILRADNTHYANHAERAGGQMSRFALPLLLAWWVYVIAFSSKAKRYFSKSPPGAA